MQGRLAPAQWSGNRACFGSSPLSGTTYQYIEGLIVLIIYSVIVVLTVLAMRFIPAVSGNAKYGACIPFPRTGPVVRKHQ